VTLTIKLCSKYVFSKRGRLVDTQQQFFSITHPFKVSVNALDDHNNTQMAVPDDEAFEKMMPSSFRLAAQMSHLDTSALRPLKGLGDNASELSDFINIQAKKINLMMSYILTLDEGTRERLVGTSFGGSHLTFLSKESFTTDQLITTKLFIDEGNCAIFAIARVIGCDVDNDGSFSINAMFVKIGEDAQEQLVRTSLHVQTLQLKERSEARRLTDSN